MEHETDFDAHLQEKAKLNQIELAKRCHAKGQEVRRILTTYLEETKCDLSPILGLCNDRLLITAEDKLMEAALVFEELARQLEAETEW